MAQVESLQRAILKLEKDFKVILDDPVRIDPAVIKRGFLAVKVPRVLYCTNTVVLLLDSSMVPYSPIL